MGICINVSFNLCSKLEPINKFLSHDHSIKNQFVKVMKLQVNVNLDQKNNEPLLSENRMMMKSVGDAYLSSSRSSSGEWLVLLKQSREWMWVDISWQHGVHLQKVEIISSLCGDVNAKSLLYLFDWYTSGWQIEPRLRPYNFEHLFAGDKCLKKKTKTLPDLFSGRTSRHCYCLADVEARPVAEPEQ